MTQKIDMTPFGFKEYKREKTFKISDFYQFSNSDVKVENPAYKYRENIPYTDSGWGKSFADEFMNLIGTTDNIFVDDKTYNFDEEIILPDNPEEIIFYIDENYSLPNRFCLHSFVKINVEGENEYTETIRHYIQKFWKEESSTIVDGKRIGLSLNYEKYISTIKCISFANYETLLMFAKNLDNDWIEFDWLIHKENNKPFKIPNNMIRRLGVINYDLGLEIDNFFHDPYDLEFTFSPTGHILPIEIVDLGKILFRE